MVHQWHPVRSAPHCWLMNVPPRSTSVATAILGPRPEPTSSSMTAQVLAVELFTCTIMVASCRMKRGDRCFIASVACRRRLVRDPRHDPVDCAALVANAHDSLLRRDGASSMMRLCRSGGRRAGHRDGVFFDFAAHARCILG